MIELHTFLACPCGRRIHIPVPILIEILPRQIPWPEDGQPQNFVCLGCSNVYEYSRIAIHRGVERPTDVLEFYKDWAVWKLSVPCGTDKCAGLIEIRVVMKKDSTLKDAIDIAAKLYAHGISCNKGTHKQTGRSNEGLSVGFEIDQDWAVRA